MSQQIRLIGSFSDESLCAHGIEKLKEAKANWHAYSPIPSREIAEANAVGPSRVRYAAFAGGLFGLLGALAITIGTSLEWNLNVGGRPIVALPAFFVVVFEVTCACAAIGATLGFFWQTRMPALEPKPGYSVSFSGDRFGLIVQCDEADSDHLESLLRDSGAEAVTREAA